MKHLDASSLRRMMDEPSAFGEQEREHARTCEVCRAQTGALRADAEFAQRHLGGGNAPPDTAYAYASMRSAIAERRNPLQFYRTAGALAAAAVLILALIFTPLGTYAKSFLTVFEPKAFEPITISQADMRNLHLLPQADKLGTQRVVRKPQKKTASSFDALRGGVPFTALKPSALPQGFGARSFVVYTPGEATFTFSSAKARAYAQQSHKKLPAMPAGLDGTMVRMQSGYVFEQHYERPGAKVTRHNRSMYPFVEIVQAQAPRVTSTGASLDVLERYLLSMPDVPTQLAEQIRALSDIQNTVPVPVVIDKQTAQHVEVQGSQGLAIGDNTGLGAGVMWQKNGIVYVVAGPVTMDQVMEVANGLR